MRYAFIQELTKLAAKNKNIILLTADLGFTVFEEFAKKFPKQFFNVGIAEPNMIGIASGLALSGKIVFAYSIASFASFRTYEHIRNDVCLHKAPVIIVGSGAGLSYADNGPTHLATQDLALMRGLPNMTVLAPADPVEAQWATREAARLKSPVYLRLGKKGEPVIYDKTPKHKIGQGNWIKRGSNFVILACGNIVFNALKSAENLEKKVDKMLIKLINVEESLKEVTQNMVTKKEFEQKTDEMLTAIDGVVKDNDDIKIEQTSNIAAHDRFEKRITRVETHLNLKAVA